MSLDNNPDQEQIYVFEDPDHNSFLLDKLNTLRKNKQFCDVILQVGIQQDVYEIYAHRAVLASASRYFWAIFTNDSNSAACGVPQIQLYKLLSNKYDVDAFNFLLDFIYTSRLEVPKRHVRNVYALASRLKMLSVVQKCGSFLASTLTPESCLYTRSINGVINDPILLNSVDNYIKENISEVIKSKYVEKLDKIKIEVLQNSDEDVDSVNPRHLFSLISDFIRKEFDENCLSSEQLLMKTYMLYLKDRCLHDCLELENGDHNYSEVIQEYKSMHRKLSTNSKRSTENVNLNGLNQLNKIAGVTEQDNLASNGNQNEFVKESIEMKDKVVQNLIKNSNGPNHHNKKSKNTNKPKQFLFTRSDSDSSLSSLANDDDENDWKILSVDSNGSKNNLNGLLMVAGKLYLLNVKLKIHSPHTTRNNSLEKPEIVFSTISLMNNVRCSLGSACLNHRLIVCGAYNRSEVLKTVEMYDASNNKWIYLEPMKVARARFNVCALDDKMYAVGGSDGLKELSSAEIYDSKENKWKFIAKCPIERSNAGVCSLNDMIYVIGGCNGHNGLERCDVYNPVTDQWKRIADLNVGRYQVSVTVLNGKIYVVGGCNYTCLNSVECYDPENDTWQWIEPMQTARRGCGVCAYDDKIYAIGGHDGVHSLASVEIYDPKARIWSKGPPLLVCRANVAVSVVDDTLFVCGGFSGKQFLNTCEYLDLKNNEFTHFLRKDLNGNLRLVKEKTLIKDDEQLNGSMVDLKISGRELCENDVHLNNGVRQDSKSNAEFKNSKEPLIEVEGEKMDESN